MSYLIHVGLPKCASTAIQVLSQKNNKVFFLGKYNNIHPQYLSLDISILLRRDILLLDDKFFFAKYPPLLLDDFCNKYTVKHNQLKFISDELLSGIGFATFYKDCIRFSKIYERLVYLLGEVHILVVYRDTIDFIHSYHHQLCKQMGFKQDINKMLEIMCNRKMEFYDIIKDPHKFFSSITKKVDFINLASPAGSLKYRFEEFEVFDLEELKTNTRPLNDSSYKLEAINDCYLKKLL
ncbi:hypothetical protein E0X81_12015 [Halomonas sp. GDM18]|nr:hypothetical protein E0X81_12015 [Halomonas sp. GDM18]